MTLRSCKKGSVMDPITVGSVILVVAITIFISMFTWYGFNNAMRDVVEDTASNETVTATLTELSTTYSYIDYMIPLMVGGLMLVSLIFAFKTGAGLVYSFVSLIAWGFAMLMAAVYTNIFETFKYTFPVVTANYPLLIFIMDNMKWIVLGWLFLISLVMFTRDKKEDASYSQGMEKYYA